MALLGLIVIKGEFNMQGAREFSLLFETGQYGRFYFVCGGHARGRTFHIFILPAGADAMPNGPNRHTLNGNAVEVFGVVSGTPGWTEKYGWLHIGKWQKDFADIVEKKKQEVADNKRKNELIASERHDETQRRIAELLAAY